MISKLGNILGLDSVNKLILLILLSCLFTVSYSTKTNFQDLNKPKSSARYNPVLFIPGTGGSQLQAKLNKTSRVHHICELVSDWFNIWVNVHLLTPVIFDCFSDNLKLHYDSATRLTHNTDGVQIRASEFGSLDSVDYLDLVKVPKTDYFENVIATLEKLNNMTRNEDMKGASYDFRKAPNELQDYFSKVPRLIEQMYMYNNYRPVTLICHSMGCLNSIYLLNRQTQKWKDTFVRRLITLAAPWDGSFKAINALFFGDNLGIPILNGELLRELQMTFPSLMYLFPKPPSFPVDRTLVETKNLNFSLSNLDELLTQLNMTDQREMWLDTRPIADSLAAPNVELWCLYGQGFPTPSKLIIDDLDDLDGKYRIVTGDGDGTVNLESLSACRNMANSQEKPVNVKVFPNVNHINILRGPEAVTFISTKILAGDININKGHNITQAV